MKVCIKLKNCKGIVKFCPILNNPAENLPKTYKIAKVGSKCRPILNNPATKDLKKAKAAKFRQIWLHC